MEIEPIKTTKLENGLILQIFDASRKLAGDRWLVVLIARVEIPVDRITFNNSHPGSPKVDDVKKALGNRVVFEQKRERIFIDEKHKTETFQSLCESFQSSLLTYISHPAFAGKFIVKEYRDYQRKKSWYPKN